MRQVVSCEDFAINEIVALPDLKTWINSQRCVVKYA